MQIPYTKPMENVIKQAGKIARERKHPYIGTEHLLLALRKEYSGVAGQVLAKNGVDAEKISRLIDELVAPDEEVKVSTRPEQSPRFQFLLKSSEQECGRLHTEYVGTEHLLLAMIRDVDCVATHPDHIECESSEVISGYYVRSRDRSQRISGQPSG